MAWWVARSKKTKFDVWYSNGEENGLLIRQRKLIAGSNPAHTAIFKVRGSSLMLKRLAYKTGEFGSIPKNRT